MSQERITLVDEARAHGKSIPDKYNEVPLVSKIKFPHKYLFNLFRIQLNHVHINTLNIIRIPKPRKRLRQIAGKRIIVHLQLHMIMISQWKNALVMSSKIEQEDTIP